MRVLQSIFGRVFFYVFVLLASFDAKAEVPPINIHCPCQIERINQTKAKVSLAIAFQKEVVDSGDLSINLLGATGINSFHGSYYPLGDVSLKSIPYSASPTEVVVELPLNFRPEAEHFMSLILKSGDDLVDQVNFLEVASPYFNPGGTTPDITSNLMFNSAVSFEYDSSTFSLNIPSINSTDLRSISETLNLEIRMYDEDIARYYTPASAEYQVTYDMDGNSSLTVTGDLDYSIDSNFQTNPDFPNLVLNISRGDTQILLYSLDVLGDGDLPDFSQTWTNIDTLLDSDGDTISDFNERILGTNSLLSNEVPTSVIEIAFTVGSSAEASEYGGSNLEATITHHIAVANSSFKDSGLAIELKNIGIYSVGDDSDLDADAVLESMKVREGIFTDLNTLLDRQPDLFMHYSTVGVINTGGKASVLGSFNDGVIDYKNDYLNGNNRGVVGIDNPSLTLVHEVGHLLGLAHSRRQNSSISIGTYPWSLGHGIDNDFVTVMAYASEFNTSRVGVFSTPNLLCGSTGKSCGVSHSDQINGADAVKSLQTTAFQISAISNGVAPVLTVVGDNPAYVSNISMASELKAKALDREDGDLTASITTETTAVVNNEEDQYVQVYSVIDSDNNTAKLSRKIIVRDVSLDTDGDGTPDYLDDDDDGDGVLDSEDAFPKDSSETVDTDGDGTGNNSDDDDDNDGVSDDSDAFPLDPSETLDTDGDSVGNNVDTDDDGDGVSDTFDKFPLDSSESVDTDADGIGNNADSDDDNDSLSDDDEATYGTNPLLSDSDFDGLPDLWELQNERNPVSADYGVDVGVWVSCGIDDTGVICWGYESFASKILDVPVLSNPRQVAAGFFHACALDDTGVVCWGNPSQIAVPELSNPTQISTSYTHTCALDDTGVVCWGDNDNGETTVPNLSNPTKVSAGKDFTCAIDELGIVCWGANSRGQLAIPILVNPTDISAGGEAVCAKDATGLICWGYDPIVSRIPLGQEYMQMATGSLHACAVSESGVDCWGNNGGSENRLAVPALENTSQISASSHTCALSDRGVSCWGKNNYGQSDTPNLFIDPDGDGFSNQDGNDDFPLDKTEWLDTDSDGLGNNIDVDDDNDSVLDGEDAFPLDTTESIDTDSDGIGNNADDDDDGDGVPDTEDAFPLDKTETSDTDDDGIGNNADTDDDGDSISDSDEISSGSNPLLADTDGDGINDNVDAFPLDPAESSDSDGDGLGDNADAFPNDSSETVDSDSDGIGDNADVFPNDPTESADNDLDGVGDNADAFPNDATEAVDSDSDGTGDNADAFPNNALYSVDSDSDGMPDEWETKYGLDPNDASDATSDQDNDGITALDEFLAGTIPSGSLDIDGNESYDALTDGLLLLRGMFGLDGSALVTGTIASDATYTESVDIESRITTLGDLADIDGNGDIDALTDGLLTLRYLFGLQGDTLINGVVAGDATRKTAEEIEAHLETLMPAL